MNGREPIRFSVKPAQLFPHTMQSEQKTGKKHLLLNHPFWLVAFLRAHLSLQERYTESLCKRISWIVAQTIAKQLISVVNTSI